MQGRGARVDRHRVRSPHVVGERTLEPLDTGARRQPSRTEDRDHFRDLGLTGDGVWNRDGWFNEGVTFDAALAHQAGKVYHYHAHPIALRYQLGDHVTYDSTANTYAESPAAVSQHSPIIAWAADGFPVYGPYGYSDPTNAASTVRRITGG